MVDKDAGAGSRRHIEMGMAAQGIKSVAELSRRSGVGRDSVYAWFRGERMPSSDAGPKVARAIGSTYGDMLRAWESRDKGLDEATVIAALEWAIQAVRSGTLPPGALGGSSGGSPKPRRGGRPPARGRS